MQRNSASAPSWRHDIGCCRALLACGSRSFFAASFLLPRRVREPATALYAFCRLADDCVDDAGLGASALHTVHVRLDRAYRGEPADSPVDRAFAAVVERHGIPRALPEALLEGLEWDVSGVRYKTLAELHAYAARVAGSVGVMMASIMGVREPHLLARAADLGVAMQLTNIARDVGEDARAGRIYLPLDWMDEAGLDAETWLANPQFTPALGRVVARVLHAADLLYRRADAGIAALPGSCRLGISTARLLYAEIGEELSRNGLNSVSRRAVVPARRKAALLLHALAGASHYPSHKDSSPCLDETQYLVDAAQAAAVRAAPAAVMVPTPWDVRAKAVWVIHLFEQLQRRQLDKQMALKAEA